MSKEIGCFDPAYAAGMRTTRREGPLSIRLFVVALDNWTLKKHHVELSVF